MLYSHKLCFMQNPLWVSYIHFSMNCAAVAVNEGANSVRGTNTFYAHIACFRAREHVAHDHRAYFTATDHVLWS